MRQNYLFFNSSRESLGQVTALFDFLWPTAVAMWNLRWQVDGYLRVRPEATDVELANRFVVGSGIRGANLRRACHELSWEQQQAEFAKFLLTNIFALHESYLKGVLAELGVHTKQLEKELQFPTTVAANGTKKGIWGAIDRITGTESQMLRDGFYGRLSSHKKNGKLVLDNLMKCYRYFKECRNCLAHEGAKANPNSVNAYANFAAVASLTDLGVSEVPLHKPVTLGTPVELELRGVVGFCDIIMRIIVTIDAELSRAAKCEDIFESQWLDKHQRRYTLKTADATKRCSQIKFLINRLNLPVPEATEDFERFLRSRQLVS